ncbi:MAG: transporter permease [Marmoricola sp.]|nr:transporter permease [Marmoricola sp.]
MATLTQPTTAGPRWDLRRLGSQYGVYVFAVLVFLATCIFMPGFLSVASIKSLLVLASILGIASIGQTLAIIVGGLDLSVASMIGLSSVSLAVLSARGWSFATTFLLILAVAVVVGVLNGLLAHRLQAPALVVTLASGSILTGVTMMLNKGSAGGTIPEWITESVSVNATTLGIPMPLVVLVWVALTGVLVLLQRRSPSFRRIYASGMNPTAARLALVRLPVVWASAFAASAAAAAIAGIFLGGFSGGANIDVGQPYLFLTIAAVVVGGTSLLGGRGGVGRTLAGAFLISNLTTLLLGVGVGTNVQQILLGTLIVALVYLYGREAHVRTRI